MDDKKERKWNWDLFSNIDKKKSSIEKKLIEKGMASTATDGQLDEATTEKLLELMERAVPLIEQVNSLYNQYRTGAERRPPNERRNILDQIMNSITLLPKPTAALRFRVRALHSKYMSYRDRWDKTLRIKEAGAGITPTELNLHKEKVREKFMKMRKYKKS